MALVNSKSMILTGKMDLVINLFNATSSNQKIDPINKCSRPTNGLMKCYGKTIIGRTQHEISIRRGLSICYFN
jgi:hypothetical protein